MVEQVQSVGAERRRRSVTAGRWKAIGTVGVAERKGRAEYLVAQGNSEKEMEIEGKRKRLAVKGVRANHNPSPTP